MAALSIQILFLFMIHFAIREVTWAKLPEETMKVDEIIRYQGYPVELHEVYTTDGYILTMQRIPYSRNQSTSEPKHPVLLQHGLASSASNWVTNLPGQSLAYILADHGYDVWLGNIRGNSYSNKHQTLNTTDKQYWDFSWQDMAEHDLPAMIKYILTNTTSKQLSYVGHSQGTLIAFAKFSADAILAQKIRTFVALAPVTTVGDITSPLRRLAPFSSEIRDTLSVFGDYSLGSLKWLGKYVKPDCDQPRWLMLCESIMFYIAGPENKNNLNETRIPVYLAHNPDDTSMKNLVHFAQMVRSRKFRQYDYGIIGNWRRYKRFTPPEYDLNGMGVSTVAFWSPEDAFSDEKDVAGLIPKLKRILVYKVDGFSHLDFVWSPQAATRIYAKILEIFKNASQKKRFRGVDTV